MSLGRAAVIKNLCAHSLSLPIIPFLPLKLVRENFEILGACLHSFEMEDIIRNGETDPEKLSPRSQGLQG